MRGWRWREQQRERQAELVVALCFLTTMGAGFLLLVLYALGGQPQLESVLLFLALAGFGAGLVIWSQRLIPAPDVTEPRHVERAFRRAAAGRSPKTLTEEAGVTRRRLLIYLMLGAVGGLLSAIAIPILSLGPSPGNTLYVTSWRRGLRLVGVNGQPVVAGDLPIGSIATVFPEGVDPTLDSNSAAVLLHVDPSLLQLPPEQAGLAAQGFIAYSKLCTHVGCPVGLFVETAARAGLPVPPIDLRRAARRGCGFGAGRPAAAPVADPASGGRHVRGQWRLHAGRLGPPSGASTDERRGRASRAARSGRPSSSG